MIKTQPGDVGRNQKAGSMPQTGLTDRNQKRRAVAGNPIRQWGFGEPRNLGTLKEQHSASDVGHTQDQG